MPGVPANTAQPSEWQRSNRNQRPTSPGMIEIHTVGTATVPARRPDRWRDDGRLRARSGEGRLSTLCGHSASHFERLFLPLWGLHERNYRPGESRLRPDCFRGLVLPETSGSKRSSTARVQKIQSCHYRAAISHYTNSVWNQEFMPQTGGEVDFLKYSDGESRWHDKGVREPGDVRGAITSSACGSSVCWQRAHRSREPLENSRSTCASMIGTPHGTARP